jgi:hypothetical protein
VAHGPGVFIRLVSVAVAFHVAPGLIILVAFVMVLFLWAAALEYVDSTQSNSGQGSSEEAVEATGTESGTVAEGT